MFMKGLKVSENPFNPQFGLKPDIFIGRETIVSDFIGSIGIYNDPNRSTIITGLRGSGKTSLLSDVAELLGEKPNVVVDITAKPGMLNDILGVIQKDKGIRILSEGSKSDQRFGSRLLLFQHKGH